MKEKKIFQIFLVDDFDWPVYDVPLEEIDNEKKNLLESAGIGNWRVEKEKVCFVDSNNRYLFDISMEDIPNRHNKAILRYIGIGNWVLIDFFSKN